MRDLLKCRGTEILLIDPLFIYCISNLMFRLFIYIRSNMFSHVTFRLFYYLFKFFIGVF